MSRCPMLLPSLAFVSVIAMQVSAQTTTRAFSSPEATFGDPGCIDLAEIDPVSTGQRQPGQTGALE
ncbi:MAG: hypothetical protein AAB403_08920 [Planctomycetota bacterium]